MADTNTDIIPLFETILDHVEAYPDMMDEPLQMQVSALAYDDYIGRLGIGRVYQGEIKEGTSVTVCNENGKVKQCKINQIFVYKGLSRIAVPSAQCGEIVMISGIGDIEIGDTICNLGQPMPMPQIQIEEPTLSMNFMVNSSPFAGKTGKYVTSRNIRERLEKELEVNVGLRVEDTDSTDTFKVSGRGELHLSILIENMRREGYEVAVSKPQVILQKMDGEIFEPVEEVVCSVPTEYSGAVISKLNLRKGVMVDMAEEGSYTRIEYKAPTRGLLGYRSEFINDTRGEGTMVRRLAGYEPYKGEIAQRANGALISTETGSAMTYALWNIQERGQLFITPQTDVYEGMIIGMSARNLDMEVNPIKNKKMTAVRSTGADEAMKLVPAKILSLEEAIEFINDDEIVECTPTDIRIRKRYLTNLERRYAMRAAGKEE
jgi:GTP-binding protein